ncbi:hypothetical protein [Kibdelosporangium phytohabitans]|uniref:hypothetical protein n=1 Tax=Kibdelosporangium phytohabitans TaxID=860235 RepID=UPI0012FC15EA|nr:hypothetical protein [Kibdelosporangium phytohabitans]MBE1465136.1 hypothetical protein [Kibdelosporangium phytohabitans]
MGSNADDWPDDTRFTKRPVSLVWLGIKDPDYCAEKDNRGCSVAGLHDKAQRLTKAGIQVLYGFYGYHPGRTGRQGLAKPAGQTRPTRRHHGNRRTEDCQRTYAKYGPGLPARKRAMDYGDTDIREGFGTCGDKSRTTCTELKCAAISRDRNKLAATFSWTTDQDDAPYVDKLLDVGKVAEYNDGKECAKSIAHP